MTPEQALNILNQATAQLQANRDVHIQISNALEVLKAAGAELAKLKAPVAVKPDAKDSEKKS